MVQSQFCLSWNSYKSSICNGLSSLQQNGEFVDMTVAADGHFVKVHQMVMALASPYLKDLITSAPCQHPVIFLNNVSHKSLCSLLEYIYTGEVVIPADDLLSFIETAKALHIKGMESMNSSENLPVRMATNVSQVDGNLLKNMITAADRTETMSVPVKRKIVIKSDNSQTPKALKPDISPDYEAIDDPGQDFDDDQQFSNTSTPMDTHVPSILDTRNKRQPMPSNLQFTVSIRGSLQVILNRYIYNLHSVTQRTGMRRWRCVDYRNHRCMAFVVSKKNVVISRGNLHNHPFHDKKILDKIEKNAVYSTLDEVVGYKDKEPIDVSNKDDSSMESMEQEEFLSLDFGEDNEPVSVKNT